MMLPPGRHLRTRPTLLEPPISYPGSCRSIYYPRAIAVIALCTVCPCSNPQRVRCEVHPYLICAVVIARLKRPSAYFLQPASAKRLSPGRRWRLRIGLRRGWPSEFGVNQAVHSLRLDNTENKPQAREKLYQFPKKCTNIQRQRFRQLPRQLLLIITTPWHRCLERASPYRV